MAVSVIDWIREKFFSGGTTLGTTNIDMSEYWQLSASINVRELAFASAVNLIANSISKCDFRTYSKNKEIQGEEFYLWNIEPNKNQNSSEFLKALIWKLYSENECLVVSSDDGSLLIADSFDKKEYALRDFSFSNVTINDYVFRKTFFMKDVLYFRLNNKDIKGLVDGLHASYGQLLEYSQKAFKKSRGQKGVLEIAAKPQGDANFAQNLQKMMTERFKPYYDADSAVLPITEGYKYTEQDRKTYNADSTRDIRAQVDDVFSFTARAFGIPPVLLLGEVADVSKAVNQLLTFCIDPLTDLLAEEINRKRYGRKEVLSGSKLVIDTKTIKHIDLLEVSGSIDKLIASGAFCVDDIRKAVREEPLNTDFSKKHYMTKNYAPADQVVGNLEGSD